ncbi:hypothetical protein CMUS01_04609 [Colletotrichum musicola]|uniref:Nucleoside phosphorylase domain-containing protein n=1 Tax=Colletotrichum musicola TaxID=2175873 RepID=A0A8H6KX10_9PEZI|nr:hypothetical protein CMUS01_04609 [Colletotrichum musicola]
MDGQSQPPLALLKRPREQIVEGGDEEHEPKRPRSTALPTRTSEELRHEDYTVAWVSALPIEMAAARAMLDNVHKPLSMNPNDSNVYVFGDIGGHNVVIACLPSGQYGITKAAIVANNMRWSFPSISIRLMVGIGGGVPGTTDIRLGDVVVSNPTPASSGVIQYDFGKTVQKGRFQHTGVLNKPPQDLLAGVARLRADHEARHSSVGAILSEMSHRNPSMTAYAHQGFGQDRLYEASYDHAGDSCDHCDLSQLVRRPARSSSLPRIHYGIIASANQVMKDGVTRDRVAKEHNVLCFEMEAAGLMDNFPCLVIRGICDYSDSHKAKPWQEYAAATAAAYAKELLSVMPSQGGQVSAPAIDRRPTGHGKPGAGKSTIMKHAFTRAKRKAANNAAVISFFLNARGEDLEKTTIGMHRSLLLQLLESLPELQFILDDVKHNIQHSSLASDLNLLRDLFDRAISNLGQKQVTCFIDALDECAEDEVRQMLDFFEDLGQCSVQNNIRLYTCFSSRHYTHMDVQYGLKLTLEDQPGHAEDMEEYVRTKLRTGTKKPGEDLVAEILQKASGVFMWVVLVVEILNKEFSRGRIFAVKKRLREIPPRLSDLFRDILTRDNENMEDLLLCVQWLIFGKRPLTREEYYFALATGLEAESLGECDSESITEEVMDLFIASSSKGLAEVTKSKNPTVQFIHESVREFLLKDGGLQSLWPQLGVNVEHSSHDNLKKCCYAYTRVDIPPTYWPDDDVFLLSVLSEIANSTRSLMAKRFPFLEYATNQLLHHANAAAKGLPQSEFLRSFSDDLQRWIRLNNLFQKRKIQRYKPYPTLWYIFAESDCDSLIKLVSMEGLDQGTLEVTKMLIGKHAQLKLNDEQTNSSLLGPGRSLSTLPILQTLLNAGIDLTTTDSAGRTILHVVATWWALTKDQISTLVLQALQLGVSIESKNKKGQTPLMVAALLGNEHLAAALLRNGADPNTEDKDGTTTLIAVIITMASFKDDNLGWRAIICLQLLEHGADTEKVALNDATALAVARRFERHDVEQLLVTDLTDESSLEEVGADATPASAGDNTPRFHGPRRTSPA